MPVTGVNRAWPDAAFGFWLVWLKCVRGYRGISLGWYPVVSQPCLTASQDGYKLSQDHQDWGKLPTPQGDFSLTQFSHRGAKWMAKKM